MSCKKADMIIATPSLGDHERKKALQKLIEEGCLNSLFTHATRSSRMDWIRNYSLLALVKFATINEQSDEVAITLQEDEIVIKTDLNRKTLREEAANLLFRFTVMPNKPRKFKKIALMGLIAGKYWEYCEKLSIDSNIEDWIRKTAQSFINTRK
ncbi:MAG: hypothetical protein ACTSSG_12570 [Candidatus Heimdallarchaeaceae archaeon]